jgi:uncharacterized protein
MNLQSPPSGPPDSPSSWLRDFGLRPVWGWLADPRFGLALVAGLAFWVVLHTFAVTGPALGLAALLSVIVLQPVVEELLFRGLLQGWLAARPGWLSACCGITRANLAVSLLFAALHFIHHPPLWAVGVLLPSLLFGYFRDRYGSVYPAIALHVFYNAGYFLLPLI